jgi:hypothetical protein
MNGDDFIVWRQIEHVEAAVIGPTAGADQADLASIVSVSLSIMTRILRRWHRA